MRPAKTDDLMSLLEMERATNTVALAHVFPADLPFPSDDVLAQWRIVLDDPTSTVLIDEMDTGPVGYVAFGGGWLLHLGVVPSWWGSGRAKTLHAAAVAGLIAAGARTTYLWVLAENHRARAFYARQGWQETGMREPSAYVPHPVKVQMTRTG
ncbi:MAG: GNAT family N-acetyltransferase [Actinomycetota bacterium]|nr:GNAT family N-acetyltransferase [Actinomycetota bacterium]